jgi:peptide methionine sulfoxide reductase msrA/msrB
MRIWILVMLSMSVLTLSLFTACTSQGGIMKKANMTEFVTKQCGTEPAFNNAYWDEHRPGIYVDVNTGEVLFTSIDKFDSGSGWPSFTKPVDNASIIEKPDASLGIIRTEVRTNASHLGHVFDDGPNGSLRYCINSASLKFIPYTELNSSGYGSYEKLFPYEKALFSGGCFWGVQHLLDTVPGVVMTEAGYTGGFVANPTYEQVSSGNTGHAESVLVAFDPSKISYKELLSYFWRLHDPTTIDRQGPDVGSQYRSAIFYFNEEQNATARQSELEFDNSHVFKNPAVTEIVAAKPFYPAEEYHQEYIDKNPLTFCHAFRKK